MDGKNENLFNNGKEAEKPLGESFAFPLICRIYL